MEEFAFPEGATLLLFTDGVTEARNAEGVFCGPGGGCAAGGSPGPTRCSTRSWRTYGGMRRAGCRTAWRCRRSPAPHPTFRNRAHPCV
ncbi:SpoIIE family protein phosphatase [Streptomyces sp. 7N604]|uniref:SpoIIE family protein phosphatase n=1 Tax=Streptomyces sp. 7N604 TaxID=3457415 RepID=UPI003FD401D8